MRELNPAHIHRYSFTFLLLVSDIEQRCVYMFLPLCSPNPLAGDMLA